MCEVYIRLSDLHPKLHVHTVKTIGSKALPVWLSLTNHLDFDLNNFNDLYHDYFLINPVNSEKKIEIIR